MKKGSRNWAFSAQKREASYMAFNTQKVFTEEIEVFLTLHGDRTKGYRQKLVQGKFQLDIIKSIYCEENQTLGFSSKFGMTSRITTYFQQKVGPDDFQKSLPSQMSLILKSKQLSQMLQGHVEMVHALCILRIYASTQSL